MINFHKYGFLDTKKLLRYVENEQFWLHRYNPIWLFIYRDIYKPEIAFENEYCFIRFFMPEVGMCYYPPLGQKNIEDGMKKILKDCKENGFDINVAPVDKRQEDNLRNRNYDLKENDFFASYIYNCEDFLFYKKDKIKRKKVKKFEKNHSNAFYREIKKEDFPSILEFIEQWHRQISDLNDKVFYEKLNMIKSLIEQLYEFDLIGLLLCDEEHIFGIAIGSIIQNMSFLHLLLALPSEEGAEEEMLSCFCKRAFLQARYLNIEEIEMKDTKNKLSEYKPLAIEPAYSTFRL